MSLNILLVNLPTGTWYKEKLAVSNSMPPLGILYIAAALQKEGYNVKVVDFAVEEFTKKGFYELSSEFNPQIIGMSTYNESWNVQKLLCEYIKTVFPNIFIIAGGAFATFCYKDILSETNTDCVLRGEGEFSFLQVCNLIKDNKYIPDKISEIKGCCWKNEDNQIVSNSMPDRIRDLDAIPYPARELVDIHLYILPFTISTSRGCPGECIFCSSKAFWGKRVIMRSAKNIFEEVMFLNQKYSTNLFYITDDTFTASKKRCKEFCELINKSEVKFVWGCESRADVVDEDLIRMLYNSGCHKIQFGLESADNEILKKIKKHVTIEQIENAVRLSHKYNMHIQASYIVGHAFDTKETVEKTLAFAKRIKEDYGARVVCSVNTPFPGTEQYEKRKEYGIDLYTEDWSKFLLNAPIISTSNLTINELRCFLGEGQKLSV